MSWNLLILKSSAEQGQVSLGTVNEVRDAINKVFTNLSWTSDSECGLYIDRGFDLEIDILNGYVDSIMTNGGYDHLAQFAQLALNQGWDILDMQMGINLNLSSPYSIYDGVG